MSDGGVLVTLRPATPADRPFLAELYASTRRTEVARAGWTEARAEAFLAEQFALQTHHYETRYPGALFFVVERAGEPVGRLSLHPGAEEVRLMDVALVPAARGQGIGGRLVAGVLAQAAARGLAVGVHVERDNPARRLYARLGFAEVEERGVYLFLRWEPPRAARP